MNRLEVWTAGVVIAAAFAVLDLVSGWARHQTVLDVVIMLGLFGIAIALFVALIIAGVRDRRRMMATARTSLDVVGGAARGSRWSALAAAGICILLFANCSGAISGPSGLGPMDDASNFFKLSAAVALPLVLVILLIAVFATAAHMLATRHQGRQAHRAALAGLVSAAIFIGIAVLTVPVGFFFGISACDGGISQGACAAGAGSFMNLFAAGTAALMLPYLTLLSSALASAPAPVPAGEAPVEQ